MRSIERHAGTIIVGASLFWWGVFIAMHIAQPEVDPLRAPGSAYVLGRFGLWARVSYFAISAALLAAGFGVAARVAHVAAARVARFAFIVGAAGAALAAVFPMDYPGPPESVSGILHAVGGGITFVSWVLGTVLFTTQIRRQIAWKAASRPLVALAGASIAGVVIQVLSVALLGFGGYAQRILLTLLFAWLIVVAAHLRAVPAVNGTSTPIPA